MAMASRSKTVVPSPCPCGDLYCACSTSGRSTSYSNSFHSNSSPEHPSSQSRRLLRRQLAFTRGSGAQAQSDVKKSASFEMPAGCATEFQREILSSGGAFLHTIPSPEPFLFSRMCRPAEEAAAATACAAGSGGHIGVVPQTTHHWTRERKGHSQSNARTAVGKKVLMQMGCGEGASRRSSSSWEDAVPTPPTSGDSARDDANRTVARQVALHWNREEELVDSLLFSPREQKGLLRSALRKGPSSLSNGNCSLSISSISSIRGIPTRVTVRFADQVTVASYDQRFGYVTPGCAIQFTPSGVPVRQQFESRSRPLQACK